MLAENPHPTRFSLQLISLSALLIVIRLFGLNRGLWYDELDSLVVSSADSIWSYYPTFPHPPLYFLFLKYWLYTVGVSEAVARIPSILASLLTLWIFQGWLGKHEGQSTSLLSVLYLGCLPLFLTYSQEVRGYMFVLLLFVQAYRLCDLPFLQQAGTMRYLSASALLGIATAVHPIALFLPLTILATILVRQGFSLALLVKSALLLIFPAIVQIALMLFILGGPQSSWTPSLSAQVVMDTLRILLGASGREWHFPPLTQPLFGTGPAIYLLIELVVLLLNLCILIPFACKRLNPYLAASAAYLLQIVVVSIFIQPVFWYRYLIPIAIPLAAMVAIQVAAINGSLIQKMRKFCFVGLLVLYISSWLLFRSQTPLQHYRQITQWLNSRVTHSDLISSVQEGEALQMALRFYSGANSLVAKSFRGELAQLQPGSQQEGPRKLSGLLYVVLGGVRCVHPQCSFEPEILKVQQIFGAPYGYKFFGGQAVYWFNREEQTSD